MRFFWYPNYQGGSKGCQPKPKAEAGNPYLGDSGNSRWKPDLTLKPKTENTTTAVKTDVKLSVKDTKMASRRQLLCTGL